MSFYIKFPLDDWKQLAFDAVPLINKLSFVLEARYQEDFPSLDSYGKPLLDRENSLIGISIDYPETWLKMCGGLYRVEPLTVSLVYTPPRYTGHPNILTLVTRYTDPTCEAARRRVFLHPHLFDTVSHCLSQWGNVFTELLSNKDLIGWAQTFWLFLNHFNDTRGSNRQNLYVEGYTHQRGDWARRPLPIAALEIDQQEIVRSTPRDTCPTRPPRVRDAYGRFTRVTERQLTATNG